MVMTPYSTFCFVLILMTFSGCGTRIDMPASRTDIISADLHQADAARTIDISYRFTGDDDGIRKLYRLTISRELENCGYILQSTPWKNPTEDHARLQMEVHHDNDGVMMLLSFITLGLVPEMRDLLTTITVRAHVGQTTKAYEEKIVLTSCRWIPVLAFLNPPPLYPHVADIEHAAMGEVVRSLVQRMRADRLLAPASQVAP